MASLTSTDEQALNEGTAPVRETEPDRLPHPDRDPHADRLPHPDRDPHADRLPHPDRDELELASVLHAFSDPVRLQIVATLAGGNEWSCGNLGLPVGKSTCSHHLGVLREAGVIVQRVDGTRKLNSLRRDDLDARFPGLLDAVVAGAPTPPPAGATPPPAGATPPPAIAASRDRRLPRSPSGRSRPL
jgi:DNA-binding transcriptional ArsR family regulator